MDKSANKMLSLVVNLTQKFFLIALQFWYLSVAIRRKFAMNVFPSRPYKFWNEASKETIKYNVPIKKYKKLCSFIFGK